MPVSPLGQIGLSFAKSLVTSVPLLAALVFNDFYLRFSHPELHGALNLERSLLDSMDFVVASLPYPPSEGHLPGLMSMLFVAGFVLLNVGSWMIRRSFFFGSKETSLPRFVRACFDDSAWLISVYLKLMVGTCFYFLTYHVASHLLFQDPARPLSGIPRLAMFFCACLALAAWFDRHRHDLGRGKGNA